MKSIFSYSRINTYQTCPQRYKINYLDKIRKPHEGIEAFMGKRVHEVLEWFYNHNKNSNSFYAVDLLLDKFNHLWDSHWHDNIILSRQQYVIIKKKNRKFRRYLSLDRHKQMFKDIGIKCIVNYYKRDIKGFTKDTIGVELKHQVQIDGVNFNCIIDRLDKKKDGVYVIYDYKTGKKPLTHSKAINDLQLSLYQLAVKEKYNDCNEIILKWYYLRTDEIISIEHNKEKLLELKNLIINQVIKINEDDKYEAKKSILCDWCYFWEECEIMSTSNPAKKL